MPSEKQWVELLLPRLKRDLDTLSVNGLKVNVETGKRLTYAYEIAQYTNQGNPKINTRAYQTDLSICEVADSGDWIPRVIIECKWASITTHDALTYSAKAATHKHVHPYLRYGIAIGGYGKSSLPPRLIRHGAYFDFMLIQESEEPTEKEWSQLIGILIREVHASRMLQQILDRGRSKDKSLKSVHRRLILE